MQARYIILVLLFVAAVLGTAALRTDRTPVAQEATPPELPAEAVAAIQEGRYWRASRILGEYLAVSRDSTPEALLVAAQAAAGWGDWAGVEALLSGRSWLDSVGGGAGWGLLGASRFARGVWTDSGEALARYLRLAVREGDRDRGVAAVKRAIALREAGKHAEAVRAFREAGRLLPQLGDWITVFTAAAASELGDTAAVRELLAGLDTELRREWGWRSDVRARFRAGDTAGALAAAESAVRVVADAGRRAQAQLLAGEIRLARGDTAGGMAALRSAIRMAPASSAAWDAGQALAALPGRRAGDHLVIGRLALRRGDVTRGVRELDAYLAAGLGSGAERARIRLEAGRALFNAGNYRAAETRLLSLAEDAPAAVAAEALYLAGRAQYRQGRKSEGRATFRRVADRYREYVPAAEALFMLADLDHDDGELERAREGYRRVIELQPDIDEAGLARMRLAGMAFLEGRHEEAAAVYDTYLQRYPQGRRAQQAAYWAARAYMELGREEDARARLREARRRNPFSYYGLRAGELLGRAVGDVVMEPAPPRVAAIDSAVGHVVERMELLQDVGWNEAASYEIARARRLFSRRDGGSYALAEALAERGHTATAIRIGWQILEEEGAWNDRLLRIVYPFPYRSIIEAEARSRGLDPYLVAGLIRQESMFSARAVSPAGAIGLMQIMPATGRTLARSAGIRRFNTAMLEVPEVNIHLGVRFFADLLDAFGRRVPAVLAAYNAGPGRVERWRAFPEYADDELFAERIPFAETREYVKIVQTNARVYASIYAGNGPAVGE